MINAYATKKKFDVLIGVGAVIRGETYHFEVVSDQSANGLMQVQLSITSRLLMQLSLQIQAKKLLRGPK
jgi:6,7-dimethyl-8-ribityllumazine synthase